MINNPLTERCYIVVPALCFLFAPPPDYAYGGEGDKKRFKNEGETEAPPEDQHPGKIGQYHGEKEVHKEIRFLLNVAPICDRRIYIPITDRCYIVVPAISFPIPPPYHSNDGQ